MSTASTTCGSSSVVGTEPVWPPPSPPCTITASTPHAATFSAWRRAPIVGMTTTPASLQLLDQSPRRAPARSDATCTPSRDQQRRCARRRRAGRRAGSRRTACRCAPSPRRSPCASWSKRHRAPSEDAEPAGRRLVAAVSRAPATQPMPVCTIGYSHAEAARTSGCAQRRMRSRVRDFASRAGRCGSMTSWIRRSSSSVGSAASRRRRRGSTSSKPVAATTSSTVTPGCTERSRMRWSGVSKSNTPRLVTTRRISWKRAASRAERGGAVVADAAHDVDLRDERPAASGSGSSSASVWLIVLPGAPRKPSSCALGLRAVADGGDVLVAVPVDLAWRPSSRGAGRTTRTSNIVRYGFQPRRPSSSAVDARRARRWRSSSGLAVGHHQVGLEASPGRGGRRSSGWCRSGWPGSRRRRGTPRPRDHADLGARRRSLDRCRRRSQPARPSGSRPRRTSRYFALNVVPRLGRLRASPRTRVWNASSRP